jgi:hypothetical protein
MAGPRKGETAANFLRRLNQESYPYFQTPKGDIEDMDQYDRDAARYQALDYLKSAAASGGNFERMQPQLNVDMRGLSRVLGQPLPPPLEPEARMIENKRRFNKNIALTYIGQNPAAAMPQGYRADARMEPYRVNNYYMNDKSLADTENEADKRNSGKRSAKNKIPKREPQMNGSLPEDADGMIPVVDAQDAIHYHRMDGGDTRIAYTEPGEMVLPKVVGERHPEVRMAIARAIRAEGGDERQYISGDPMGNYDKKTGAQKFAWYDFITKGADYVANKPWAQSAVTGLGVAGLGKLSGQSTKSALYTGLGAGLGSYVGRGASNLLKTEAELDALKARPIQDTFKGKGEDYEGTLDDLKAALTGSFKAIASNKAANTGAGVGAMLGAQNAPLPPAPNINPGKYPVAQMAEILPTEYFDQFKPNEAANISATLPQSNPIAPMTAAYLPEGVTYRDKVKDRETGDYRYTNSSRQDQSAFARAIAGTTARRGRGFGNMILV